MREELRADGADDLGHAPRSRWWREYVPRGLEHWLFGVHGESGFLDPLVAVALLHCFNLVLGALLGAVGEREVSEARGGWAPRVCGDDLRDDA